MTAAPAALEALAGALGPGFSTTLVHRADRRPRLTVVDRHTQAATEVCADDHGRYLWPWAAPAAITSDPVTAARAITSVLRPPPDLAMSEQQTVPGPDEITLSAPAAGQLCSTLEHRRAGRPAQVVVTLGPMGVPDQHREALWLEAWGKPCPMCSSCWQATRQVAQAHRPGLVITGTTRAPAG